VKAVTEGHALAGRHDEIAGGLVRKFFKIVPAKRGRGEQPVVADVPPRRKARVLRMIENGGAESLAGNRSVVIAPRGAFAPSGAVAHAFAVDDVAGGLADIVLVGGQTHRL